jgi:hypothetical protein
MLDTPRSEIVWEYWLPTSFTSFPFTSPPVRHRVPSGFKRTIHSLHMKQKCYFLRCKIRRRLYQRRFGLVAASYVVYEFFRDKTCLWLNNITELFGLKIRTAQLSRNCFTVSNPKCSGPVTNIVGVPVILKIVLLENVLDDHALNTQEQTLSF